MGSSPIAVTFFLLGGNTNLHRFVRNGRCCNDDNTYSICCNYSSVGLYMKIIACVTRPVQHCHWQWQILTGTVALQRGQHCVIYAGGGRSACGHDASSERPAGPGARQEPGHGLSGRLGGRRHRQLHG